MGSVNHQFFDCEMRWVVQSFAAPSNLPLRTYGGWLDTIKALAKDKLVKASQSQSCGGKPAKQKVRSRSLAHFSSLSKSLTQIC